MSDIDLSVAYLTARKILREVGGVVNVGYRDRLADALIDSVAPGIEAAVSEQIARDIDVRMERDDAQGSTDFSEGLWSGLNEAKHIAARGEQP